MIHSDPRNPQRFAFLRKLTGTSDARADTPPTATEETSIMNTHVDRRVLLTASTAVPLAFASAAAHDGGVSTADADPMANSAAADVQLDSHRQLMCLIKAHREAEKVIAQVCHLGDSVELGREPTRKEKRIVEKAHDAEMLALDALCQHRCLSTIEQETKGRYLLFMARESILDQYHIEMILESLSPLQPIEPRRATKKAIAWVKRMHSDGHVFVCRGHLYDIDNYAIRNDLIEGDDTEHLLGQMERFRVG